MQAIQDAIQQAIPDDTEAADRVWAAIHAAMKEGGMILLDKPVTVSMLSNQIEKTGKFEQALAEVAQELNEALTDFDYAITRDDIGKTLKAVVDTARHAVKLVENANPNWPLYKQLPKSAEDHLWEHHFLRGTFPSEEEILAASKS